MAAYTKIFLADGCVLEEKSPQNRDTVLEIGDVAELRLLSFLSEHNNKARGAQKVPKSMRKLHRAGPLNKRVFTYRLLQVAGALLIFQLRTKRT